MRKDVKLFGIVLSLVVMITSGFSAFNESNVENFYVEDSELKVTTVPNEEEAQQTDFNIPFLGKSYVGFKQALAAKESAGKYDLVNSYGYMGKYQFGKSTMRNVGVFDKKVFLNSPALQEKAFDALLAINKWELRKEIKLYNGRIIKGVKITESGLLAAAHLGGASSVKAYLKSNGTNGFKDGYGTSLKSYIRKFKGFDTTNIKANRFAKVNS
jgi:hypothetical protein